MRSPKLRRQKKREKTGKYEPVPDGLDLSDAAWLHKRYINADIGFGIFTTKEIKANALIAEYKGQLLTALEGEDREDLYQALQLIILLLEKPMHVCD